MRLSKLTAVVLLAGCPIGDDPDDPITGIPFGGELIVDADQTPPADAEVVLIQLTFEEEQDGLFFGDIWKATPVTGLTADSATAFSFNLPESGPDVDFSAPEEEYPDFEVALFTLGAYADDTGDGQAGEGDTFVGATGEMLAYAKGEIPSEYADMGAETGWNLVTMEYVDDGGPTAFDALGDGISDFSLPANLVMRDRGALPGILVPDTEGIVQIDVYSMLDSMAGITPENPTLHTMSLDGTGGNATFAFNGPWTTPPDDHYVIQETPGIAIGVYVGIAYIDDNENEAWDPESEQIIASTMGAGEDSRMLFYVHPTGLEAGVLVELFGMDVGFNLVTMDEESEDGPPPVSAWSDGWTLDNQEGGE